LLDPLKAAARPPQMLQSAQHSASVVDRMRQVFKTLGLLLLLMAAQQGAVVHELSHVPGALSSELRVQSDGAADTTCALCPAFAQVVTPAFSHSFHIPLLVRFALDAISEPRYVAIDAAVPRPRSRGPPSLS
jgi:hypothetical protein